MDGLLTALFTPKRPAPESNGPPSKRARGEPQPGRGLTVAAFSGWSYYQQTLLLELDHCQSLALLPANTLCPQSETTFGSHTTDHERPVQLAPGIKGLRGLSGGRSMRRPTWFSNLAHCSASIFSLENRTGYQNLAIGFHLKNTFAADSPVLFIVAQPLADANGVVPAPLFAGTPSVAEFASKLGFDASLLSDHPVRIVLCSYEFGAGRRLTRSNPVPGKSVQEHPQAVAEALQWLADMLGSNQANQAWSTTEAVVGATRKSQRTKLATPPYPMLTNNPDKVPAALAA
eukprot:TRINITY_DN16369_c0_g1_i1.p1 TRINITY_DN16369_c0_g1~~TRINITY_DN16369_c0_g1_i1.p1  ORF type:complete len:295 (+),score=46.00 TRINITY_DN16369_c0_g1_i1:22-885(+)